MKDKIIDFLKTKGHLVIAAICLVAVAITGLVIVNTEDELSEPVISYSTPVYNGSDSSGVNGTDDSDSTDVSRPIKDENSGSDNTNAQQKGQIAIVKPLSGDVQTDFAANKLVYNTTLQEWRTHSGVDIKGDAGCDIKAAANGKISAIKNDPKYGLTVVIEHSINGRDFTTVYCGLKEISKNISEGVSVKSGDTIATLGEDIFCEKAQGAHLHFELSENNIPLNPQEYWK